MDGEEATDYLEDLEEAEPSEYKGLLGFGEDHQIDIDDLVLRLDLNLENLLP